MATRDELYARFGIAAEAAQLFETELGTLLLSVPASPPTNEETVQAVADWETALTPPGPGAAGIRRMCDDQTKD